MREASVKSTTTSVSSASACTTELVTSSSSRPRPCSLTRQPAAMKNIGGVRGERSARREIAPNNRITNATPTSGSASIYRIHLRSTFSNQLRI